MAPPRLDPATPGSPVLGAVVTTATLTRVLRIAAARGVSKSVVTRELLELGIQCLDAGGPDASRWRSPLSGTPLSPHGGRPLSGPRNGKSQVVSVRIPVSQVPPVDRLAAMASLNHV